MNEQKPSRSSRITRRTFVQGATMTGFAAVLAACGLKAPDSPTVAGTAPGATVNPVNPGKLTIMLPTMGGERFDRAVEAEGEGGANYAHQMHAMLLFVNRAGQASPGLASAWKQSSNGLSWTLTIRKGVKFHDGTTVTAEDVLWSLRHYFSGEYPKLTNLLIALTDKVEQTGPDEITYYTKVPANQFAFQVSDGEQWFGILPKRSKLHDDATDLAFDEHPIGAGPLKLVKHVKGSSMTFERFDDYYYQPSNGLPEDRRMRFTTLDMQVVPEAATRLAAIQAGRADIAPVDFTLKKQVEAAGARLVFGEEGISLHARWMGTFDPKLPAYDARFRQALDYAIDRNQIRDKLFGGAAAFATRGWGLVTPSTIGYSAGLDPIFDPTKAKQLMADAGYPGGKGSGKLIVNVASADALPFLIESAEIAADSWRTLLGLDVVVKTGDANSLKTQQASGALNGQIWWRSIAATTDATNGVQQNFGDPKGASRVHDDAALFAEVKAALTNTDPATYLGGATAIYLKLRQLAYWIGVGYANIPWAVGPRVLAWQPDALRQYPSALHTVRLS